MKYLSLFSGIEAFTQAVHDFGWTCVGVSEIDPFACEVLKTRLPHVHNLGDITKITKEKLNDLKQIYEGIDLVVGGSPCQSFSVAGLRKGLEDPRGNLMLEYVRVVATVRPSWFIWENVPGALSSGKGQDFGTLLQAMAQLGYSLGWRVLDAQHYGVPQRRRRVFLVGSLNKKDGPFKVLFERQSSKGYSQSSGKAGQSNSSKTQTSTRKYGQDRGGSSKKGERKEKQVEDVTMLQNNQWNARIHEKATESFTLTAAMGEGGGHVPMIVESKHIEIYRKSKNARSADDNETWVKDDKSNTLASFVQQPNIAIIEHEMEHELCSTLCARDYKGPSNDDFTATSQKLVLEHQYAQQNVQSKVRKLTPIECERLQGFPDDYTCIPYRKKEAKDCPDSPRYKALGNSMAVPVMRWLACRIALVEGYLVPSFRPIVVEQKTFAKTTTTYCIQGDIAEGKRMGQNGIGFTQDKSYTLQAHSGTTPAIVVEE